MKTSLPLPVRTPSDAPKGSREWLEGAQKKFGFLPNLLGMLGNAPAMLEGYLALSNAFDKSSLSVTERQVVLLAASAENGCEYCMAAHSAIAGMQRIDGGVIAALRAQGAIADARLEALRLFTIDVVRERGWPSPTATERFTAAGYSAAQALEVVLGVGLKTLSNYANHLAGTPLDASFAPVAWTRPACADHGACATK